MSFRSKAVTATLNRWELHSAFLETSGGETNVTIWLNNKIAVEGVTGNPFNKNGTGLIKDLHAGLYGDDNVMTLYNDEFKVYFGLTGGVREAAQIIAQELNTYPASVNLKGECPGNIPDCNAADDIPQCADGIDNDLDGKVDYRPGGGGDSDCKCKMGSEGVRALTECSDGIDNDGNGWCDTAAKGVCTESGVTKGDSGCPGVNDDLEKSNPRANYPLVEFWSDDTRIKSGEKTILRFNTRMVSKCTASGSWDNEIFKDRINDSFEQEVKPERDAVYILDCQGAGGRHVKKVAVSVDSSDPPESGLDTTPPAISNLLPSGSIPSNSTSATLSLVTNESANCRYATMQGVSYVAMRNSFSPASGGLAHSKLVSGMSAGSSKRYFVRCIDVAGNANTSDSVISFSVGGGGGTDRTKVFQESNGLVVMEAENYNTMNTRAGHSWVESSSVSGASGSSYMLASPDDNTTNGNNRMNNSDLAYKVNFSNPGVYYVWVRGRGVDGSSDSVHGGFNNFIPSGLGDITSSFWKTRWDWGRMTLNSSPASFVVPVKGTFTFHLYMREDGFMADKIILTTHPSYNTGTGPGPAESSRI